MKVEITSEQLGVKISKILREKLPNLFPSKKSTYEAFKRNEITLGDKVLKEEYRAKDGDVITVRTDLASLNEWKNKIDLDVVRYDQEFAVIWKPNGMVCNGREERTLELGAEYTLNSNYAKCVYTLPRSAMGLVIVSKSQKTTDFFNSELYESKIYSTWECICQVPIENQLVVGDSFVVEHSKITILTVANSKHTASGFIAHLKIEMPLSNTVYNPLRTWLHDSGFPVLGNSKRTVCIKSVKDKGNYEALTEINYRHPGTLSMIYDKCSLPEKFMVLLDREQSAWNKHVEALNVDKGRKEFCGLKFYFNSNVLMPRNSSQILVFEACKIIESLPRKQFNILDLGTGTGCLLLSILHPLTGIGIKAAGIGLDNNQDAIDIAIQNTHELCIQNTKWIRGDFTECPSEEFDLIICNPPYLTEKKYIEHGILMINEPRSAIVAGKTGLEAYYTISKVLSSRTHSFNLLIEIPHGSSKSVIEIFNSSSPNWRMEKIILDPRKLELDSAPIIKSAAQLYELSENIITVPEVLLEMKDQKTLQTLAALPHTIQTKTPSEEAMTKIVNFAKMTGDFASLSLTDIKVLALTLQLEWEANGREHLRDEPVKLQTKAGNTTVQPIPIKESNVENEPSTKKKRVRPKKKEKKNADVEMSQEPELSAEPAETQKDEIVESDSDGEWITPQNISEHKKKDSNLGLAEIQPQKSISVGCITDDFAMQNVLLQMKLNLLSIDGMLIKKLKNWVLRCHACFKITTQMDKVFCPTCGNNTLIRTSIAIDQNGKMTIYLKKNFQYNNRGTVYSIPAPKGGRNSKDLILREDQNEHLKALAAKKRLDKKALNQDVTMDELLAFGQPGARLSATGNPVIGYGRKNPNDVRNRKKK